MSVSRKVLTRGYRRRKNPARQGKDFLFIAAALGGLYVLYQVIKGVKAVAGSVPGILTGNNALTQGTPYQGAGVVGTAGAAANAVTGGILQSAGESIGNTFFDWFNPNAGKLSPIYTVLFPDGNKHAVDSALVNAQGEFIYGGVSYVLGTDSSGNKFALAE